MRAGLLLAGLAWAVPAPACNPDAPRPPILEWQAYDDVARDFLLANAPSVAVLRFAGTVELVFQQPGGGRPPWGEYLFEVVEGWGEVLPARLTVSGYWIPCEPGLAKNGHYLGYMEGQRPLYLLPAGDAEGEIERLDGVDWFYDVRGQLVRPELLEELDQAGPGGAGAEGEQP